MILYISGPEFWGLVNPEWSMCTKGKKQSPINVDPRQLLYDPNMKHLHIDKHRVSNLSFTNIGYICNSLQHGGKYTILHKHRMSMLSLTNIE